MNQIALENSTDFNDLFRGTAFKQVNFIQIVLKTSLFVLGIVGLLFASIVLLLFVPFAMWSMRSLNRRIKAHVQDIYELINTNEPHQLRKLHLETERARKQLRSFYKPIIDKNVITMGISSQLHFLYKTIEELEISLKRAAYPELNIEMNEEDIAFLEEAFEGIENDWSFEDLQGYEKLL